MTDLAGEIFDGLSSWLTRRLRPLHAKMDTLSTRQSFVETRVLELGGLKALTEGAPPLVYRGVWASNQPYVAGSVCTDHGSAWHASKTTLRRPGESRDWTLIVKRGGDGKDGMPGPRGAEGPQGPQGDIGPMPRHRWTGTVLQFQQGPDGTWSEGVDLRGPKGEPGQAGGLSAMGFPMFGGGAPVLNTYFPSSLSDFRFWKS